MLKKLQVLSKSLVYPIALLPFAAVLLRFGALGLTYAHTGTAGYYISVILQAPASVVFDNLGLWFAIAIAFGLAKDQRGEAALLGGLGYLILVAMTSASFGGAGDPTGLHIPDWFYKNILVKDGFSQLLYAKGNGGNYTYLLNTGVFGGITVGCIVAYLYNKFNKIQLPVYLSFFSGRRFVPMITLVTMIPVGLAFCIIWPWFQYALNELGVWLSKSGTGSAAAADTAKQAGAVFIYGVINRILLPFGLHHVINTILWFGLPFTGQVVSGANKGDIIGPVFGDITAFNKAIGGAGMFETGYFPMFLGGLPAIGFAMIYSAKKENRKAVAGFLGGAMAVAFLTGISEPLEFSFLFLSPILWFCHALFTGILGALTVALHIRLSFGFSAGLIDYIVSLPFSWNMAQALSDLNYFGNNVQNTLYIGKGWSVAANPLWIFPLAGIAFAMYFFSFKFLIRRYNIQTPGRGDDVIVAPFSDKEQHNEKMSSLLEETAKKTETSNINVKARNIIDYVGGPSNIEQIENCTTRLRFTLKDLSIVQEKELKAISFGLIKVGKNNLQVVVGMSLAEPLKDEIKNILNH